MRKVVCINDKKQPEGGELVEGREYEVEKEFINNYEQKVFVIVGINNYGMTKLGMRWYGYDAKRYAYGIAYAETRYKGPFHWNYNPAQTSCVGAEGPMQIMLSTAIF